MAVTLNINGGQLKLLPPVDTIYCSVFSLHSLLNISTKLQCTANDCSGFKLSPCATNFYHCCRYRVQYSVVSSIVYDTIMELVSSIVYGTIMELVSSILYGTIMELVSSIVYDTIMELISSILYDTIMELVSSVVYGTIMELISSIVYDTIMELVSSIVLSYIECRQNQ